MLPGTDFQGKCPVVCEDHLCQEAQNAAIDSPRAWLIVVAAFFASFVAFGVSYSFGIFLKPMATEFGVSHAVMSSLFSVP